MISEPRPTDGFRQSAKEFARMRLLALLEFPDLERRMVHDRARLAHLDSVVHDVADSVALMRLAPSSEPVRTEPIASSGREAELAWRDGAQTILARHAAQTVETVDRLRERYRTPVIGSIAVFDLIERLGQCIDPTDCRLFGVSQLSHVLLMIEAMQEDGVLTPDLLLAALIHDLGKLLLLTDEDPANVVCMNSPIGEYADGVGLDNVVVQWNHDEFAYSRLVDLVPDHISWLIRYHSIDPSAVLHLMDDRDRRYAEKYLNVFTRYDHDTKTPYHAPTIRLDDYRDVIEEAFPKRISF